MEKPHDADNLIYTLDFGYLLTSNILFFEFYYVLYYVL